MAFVLACAAAVAHPAPTEDQWVWNQVPGTKIEIELPGKAIFVAPKGAERDGQDRQHRLSPVSGLSFYADWLSCSIAVCDWGSLVKPDTRKLVFNFLLDLPSGSSGWDDRRIVLDHTEGEIGGLPFSRFVYR